MDPLGAVWVVAGGHYGLTGRPIKNAKVTQKLRNGAQKGGMMTRKLEHNSFLPVIENYLFQSKLHQIFCLQCHLAGAFCFIFIIYFTLIQTLLLPKGKDMNMKYLMKIIKMTTQPCSRFGTHPQQNNLLKSCKGSLVKSDNCNRTASPPDLAHCAPPPSPREKVEKSGGELWKCMKTNIYINRMFLDHTGPSTKHGCLNI